MLNRNKGRKPKDGPVLMALKQPRAVCFVACSPVGPSLLTGKKAWQSLQAASRCSTMQVALAAVALAGGR